ncbi:putative Xaa-Pro aminopeptidase 3-like [Tropilaelaps mercedesae]|uniref:Putative Xaa-Pro aminopeptidase 3-like n=1 Tax=Tropilaelaps mercedesae TaxID=418985 RepID=A0A1V9XFB0_9ACAR|nr:putative Xaa-Pro aminopeptidase 3-like [Tropilaelaps mercedesae]
MMFRRAVLGHRGSLGRHFSYRQVPSSNSTSAQSRDGGSNRASGQCNRSETQPYSITASKGDFASCAGQTGRSRSPDKSGELTPLPRRGCSVTPLGQPTSETHPHLVKEGECIAGFTASELANRRERLFALLCAKVPTMERHMVVIPSASKVLMTEKIPYSFRQNSNFYYLCGFMEPDSVLIIHGKQGERPSSALFVPKHDPLNELWDGPRTGPFGAKRLLEVDEAYTTDEVENFITRYPKAMQWLQPTNYLAVDHLLKGCEAPELAIQKLRLIKSPAEVEVMQKAADVTCESLVETIRASHPFVLESQLGAKFDFECKIRGAQRPAYPPVIAGGDRANIIHYIASNQMVFGDEMVLMDAGAEVHLYASDVTRTWPVTGRFTRPQRDVYQLLQEVHEKLVAMLYQWDFYTLDDLFEQMCVLIARGLQELAVVDSRVTSEADLRRIGYQFCPHHVSHYLGMDVHDTPLISRKEKLCPGMVVTIEPGIYIPQDNIDVPIRYRGLGVRIEDDVLITKDGPRILSRKCPRTAEAIEALFP